VRRLGACALPSGFVDLPYHSIAALLFESPGWGGDDAIARGVDREMTAEAPPDLARLQKKVVGHQLPGGSFEIAEYERWLGHDAMLAPPLPPGLLHPVWIMLGALRGMGVSIEELVGLAEAAPTDGVLFGETTLEQHHPLQV